MHINEENEPLTLQDVSSINLARCNQWHPNGIGEWSPNDWATALTGELGELCNALKKMRRTELGIASPNNIAESEMQNKLMEEIGGTYLYLDLLLQRLGLNWDTVLPYEFNRISHREGLNYWIGSPNGLEKPTRSLKLKRPMMILGLRFDYPGANLSVLDAILKERHLQIEQWGGIEHDDKHDTIDWVDFIDKQLSIVAATSEGQRYQYIKIAALAIAALESHDRKLSSENGLNEEDQEQYPTYP